MRYYIYILHCSNGALYTGYTTDIERRYREHQVGSKKCKYTRSFPPTHIAACWEFLGELSDVLRIERVIKNLNRHAKQAFISSEEQWQLLGLKSFQFNSYNVSGTSSDI